LEIPNFTKLIDGNGYEFMETRLFVAFHFCRVGVDGLFVDAIGISNPFNGKFYVYSGEVKKANGNAVGGYDHQMGAVNVVAAAKLL